ncbi:hypothetical protein QOT17_018357 [Balamuthia mandrillaris]
MCHGQPFSLAHAAGPQTLASQGPPFSHAHFSTFKCPGWARLQVCSSQGYRFSIAIILAASFSSDGYDTILFLPLFHLKSFFIVCILTARLKTKGHVQHIAGSTSLICLPDEYRDLFRGANAEALNTAMEQPRRCKKGVIPEEQALDQITT